MQPGLVRSEHPVGSAEISSLEFARPSLSRGYSSPPQQPGLTEYWRLLLKRKWIIVAAVVVLVTLAAVVSVRMTPLYEATGRIAINRESGDVLGFKDQGGGSSDDDYDYTVALETQVRILGSDALAMAVIRDLHLDGNPLFAGKAAPTKNTDPLKPDELTPAQQSSLLGHFKSGLKLQVIPRTRILEISYLSPDPKISAQVVNALAHAYVEQNFKTKFDSTMQTSEWLSSQLSDLQIKVQTSQEKLVRFQKEHGILGIDEKQNIVTSKLEEINKELTQAEADRIRTESLYRIIQSGDSDLVASVETNVLLQNFRQRQAELKVQLAQARTQFGPAFPKVHELENQLAETEMSLKVELGRIAARAKNEYLTSYQRERMLRAALEQQKQEANNLNESAITYNLLKRDVDSNRQLYEGLLTKMKEASVSAGLRSSNVRIVDAARVPTAPSKPNIPRNLLLAAFIGLAGGVGLTFLLEALDNTVTTPDLAQVISGLPSLGVIPLSTILNGKNRRTNLVLTNGNVSERDSSQDGSQAVELITHARPKSEIAESYRSLRTSILLSSLGHPPGVILVTSALPQEGKTTTSINCAIVLAQRGARVLLVDADLRRPGIHRALGITSKVGLSTVLTGTGTLADSVIVSQIPNMFVLPSGPIPPQPAELLGSDLMRNLLRQCRQQYDHIVIDTPPTLSVTDAVLLSVEADSVLLVIRSGSTTKEALRRSSDLLQQVSAKVTGVVINAVNTRSPDMYHYYYAYGGHYYDDEHRK